MNKSLHWVVPGPLDQRTGGYIYDRHIVDGLRAAGWDVNVHELAGRFPDVDAPAIGSAAAAIERMDDGLPIIDGLALPAFADLADLLPERWVGLIHHPLAMETGLSEEEVADYLALESRLMRRAAKLIVTSPKTRRDLAGFDIDPADVSVVVPGVEPAPLARGSEGEAPTWFLCVGTLTPRKGHLVLLSALSGLLDLDWQLISVGSAAWDPEHARRIEQAIHDLGLDERVTLIGEQDDQGLAGFYDRADLFVLASHHEGYGMVLAEALARGLPVVSTTAGAIPDTVPAGAGRLVPPDDAAALAAALRVLLTDRVAYDSLAEGASIARRTLPSWPSSVRRFAAILEGVVTA